MTGGGVRIEAPAKVNLRLRVLARESGGYHSLESLFCAIGLSDVLTIHRAEGGVALEVGGGIDTGPVEENLVVRAARRFLEAAGGGGGVRIALEKRIPAAAGLGGGSSDAAATLRGMNRLFGDSVSEDALLQLGIELGSDVPFFLGGSALALGWGRGERLLALPPLPHAEVVVAHPGEPMPTGGAFRRIGEMRGGDYHPRAFRMRLEGLGRWEGVAEVAGNDFEPVALEAVPRLADGLGAMRAAGAAVALLAGSGASIFGVFPEGAPPEGLGEELRAGGFSVWRTRTLSVLPDPETLPAPTA